MTTLKLDEDGRDLDGYSWSCWRTESSDGAPKTTALHLDGDDGTHTACGRRLPPHANAYEDPGFAAGTCKTCVKIQHRWFIAAASQEG